MSSSRDSEGKESASNVGRLDSIPGLGSFPGDQTHSSILAWRIPWTEESGKQQSVESQSQTWLSY